MGHKLTCGYQPEIDAEQGFDQHILFHNIEIGHTIPEHKDIEDFKTGLFHRI